MSKEEIRAQAKSWGEHATFIACYRCRDPLCDNHHPHCELCDRPICALPQSIATGYHLICRECEAILVPGNVMRFRGRYTTSEQANRVLSKGKRA